MFLSAGSLLIFTVRCEARPIWIFFEQAKKNAIIVNVDGLRLPVVSVKELIKMKSRAARRIDREDINQLKKINKIR